MGGRFLNGVGRMYSLRFTITC